MSARAVQCRQRHDRTHRLPAQHGGTRHRSLLRPGAATRFLVADETGLGKTMVARGVIARAIEELEHDPDVDRIDVVYVCSNTDIAHQNLNALDVTGDEQTAFASRLTLLAKHSRHLTRSGAELTKPVNLISFTPGTSFDKGWQTGKPRSAPCSTYSWKNRSP